MKGTRFLLSVVFQLHKLNTYEWVGYVVQEKHCHRYGFIEVDEENLGDLGKLLDNKLESMYQEVNADLREKYAVVTGGIKLLHTKYLLRSHSLVRI